MIKTKKQYEETMARLLQERERLAQLEAVLARKELSVEERDQVLGLHQGTIAELEVELQEYQDLKQGLIRDAGLQDIGRLLIALRIAKGTSQAELARLLGVHPSQVSRDERNEYHAANLSRIHAVLVALNAVDQVRVSYRPSDSSAA